MSEQKKQAITREQFARLINGQSTAGDIRAEINEESQLCDYSVYMEATASYTFEVEASSVEQALELARAGEDEDGELFDEIDLETHEGEPTLVYQRGVTGPVWSKPADKDEDEPDDPDELSSKPLERALSYCGDNEDDAAMMSIEELEREVAQLRAEVERLSWAKEPYLVMHPALRERFPDGIRVAVDTLAGDDPPGDEGLLFAFLAYVACVTSVPMEELSIYDLTIHEWEDGEWLLIT